MTDEEITLCNTCTDLISLKKSEAFPLHLLRNKQPGDWIRVREVCEDVGVPPRDLTPEVFAAWLPDPLAQEGYAVILFYDDESKWSMTAHYNRARLLESAMPHQSLQANGVAKTKPQEAVPAAEF